MFAGDRDPSSMLFWSQEETYKFLCLQAVCVLSAWVIASRDREARESTIAEN